MLEGVELDADLVPEELDDGERRLTAQGEAADVSEGRRRGIRSQRPGGSPGPAERRRSCPFEAHLPAAEARPIDAESGAKLLLGLAGRDGGEDMGRVLFAPAALSDESLEIIGNSVLGHAGRSAPASATRATTR